VTLLKQVKELLVKALSKKSVIFALCMLLPFAAVGIIKGNSLFPASVCLAVLYVASVTVYLGYDRKKTKLSSESPMLSGLALDYVMQSTLPVVIINKAGDIAWYNKAFATAADIKGTLYGKSLAEKINPSLTPARLFREDALPMFASLGGVQYEISSTLASSSGKQYCITVWQDKTDLLRAKHELSEKNVLVAFIVIDNFSEAMQFVQDKSRTALAVIGSEIDKWSASVNGIMKEYDREKYIIMFEEKYLSELCENRFEILDRIRSITVDDVVMQFTASIGIACSDGTLAEKEAASRVALDHALQRGGDQAVVKTRKATEYYGGRSKSVQKKTKVRSRVFANELCTFISKSSNVIVMGHKYADHDSVASCVAVSRLAKYLGKPVNVVVNIHDYNLKPIFNSMRGKKEYKEYADLFVDRESAQELIRSETLLIVCDVNNPALFEVPELYESAANFIIIDHHRKTGELIREPVRQYIEPASSSVSELMCEILEQVLIPGTLTQAEANLLFSGIILDTKQFTKNTGVGTFGAALYLRSEGASPFEAQKLFRTNIQTFMRESAFENNIQIYRDCIAISVYEGDADGKDRIVAAKAADRLLSVEGVSTSFVLCMIGDEVTVSARSDGNINVQLVLEKFGGGGHFDAAGAQLKNVTLVEAVEKLKSAIDDYLHQ